MIPLAPPRPRPEEPEHPFAGFLEYQGVPIDVETAGGDYRRGVADDGTPWEVKLPCHYGEVRDTVGADGDAVDVFIGPDPFAPFVYVVQSKLPGSQEFDETKSMLGFRSQRDAIECYRAAYAAPGFFQGVKRWPFGAWKEAVLNRPKIARGRMDRPLRKARMFVNLARFAELMKAAQLGLFGGETPEAQLPTRKTKKRTRVKPHVRQTAHGAVFVHGHDREAEMVERVQPPTPPPAPPPRAEPPAEKPSAKADGPRASVEDHQKAAELWNAILGMDEMEASRTASGQEARTELMQRTKSRLIAEFEALPRAAQDAAVNGEMPPEPEPEPEPEPAATPTSKGPIPVVRWSKKEKDSAAQHLQKVLDDFGTVADETKKTLVSHSIKDRARILGRKINELRRAKEPDRKEIARLEREETYHKDLAEKVYQHGLPTAGTPRTPKPKPKGSRLGPTSDEPFHALHGDDLRDFDDVEGPVPPPPGTRFTVRPEAIAAGVPAAAPALTAEQEQHVSTVLGAVERETKKWEDWELVDSPRNGIVLQSKEDGSTVSLQYDGAAKMWEVRHGDDKTSHADPEVVWAAMWRARRGLPLTRTPSGKKWTKKDTRAAYDALQSWEVRNRHRPDQAGGPSAQRHRYADIAALHHRDMAAMSERRAAENRKTAEHHRTHFKDPETHARFTKMAAEEDTKAAWHNRLADRIDREGMPPPLPEHAHR